MSSPLGTGGSSIGRRLAGAFQRFADLPQWTSQVGQKLDEALTNLRQMSVSLPRTHATTHKGGDDSVMYASAPAAIVVGGGAVSGDPAAGAAPGAHRHALAVGVPVSIGSANAAGASGNAADASHVHALDDPALVQALGGLIWERYTLNHAAVQAGAMANDIELLSLPARGLIHAVAIKHSVSFAGGAISSYTLSVGITGTLAKYAAAFDVFQAPGDTVFQVSTIVGAEDFGSATSIRVAAASGGANLDQTTAGDAELLVLRSNLPTA